MENITIRKMHKSDEALFKKWWRSVDLIKLTSGDMTPISDIDVSKYFLSMLNSENDYQYIIDLNKTAIGHISLSKRPHEWYEVQIIIGEIDQWGKGYGSDAINELVKTAHRLSIARIFLEVRPTNTRAIRAYEKCGFKSVSIVKYLDNINLPETLRMELIL